MALKQRTHIFSWGVVFLSITTAAAVAGVYSALPKEHYFGQKPYTAVGSAAIEVASNLHPYGGADKGYQRPNSLMEFHWVQHVPQHETTEGNLTVFRPATTLEVWLPIEGSNLHDRIDGRNYASDFPLPKEFTVLEDVKQGVIAILYEGYSFKEAYIFRVGFPKLLYYQGVTDGISWRGSADNIVSIIQDYMGRGKFDKKDFPTGPVRDSITSRPALPVREFAALQGITDFKKIREGRLHGGGQGILIDVEKPVVRKESKPVLPFVASESLLERFEKD